MVLVFYTGHSTLMGFPRRLFLNGAYSILGFGLRKNKMFQAPAYSLIVFPVLAAS